MRRRFFGCLLVLLVLVVGAKEARGESLSIYDVQYTTDSSGNSPYMDSTVDCGGGLVINKWVGGSVKLTLWDPSYASGWGGVVVKDFSGTGAFGAVEVGDWVSFTGVLVEENGGNTQLGYVSSSGMTRDDDPGIALPGPVEITDAAFGEAYESMLVQVSDVMISALDLGYYGDNYNLNNGNGDYWAGDYMNADKLDGQDYHPAVGFGNSFESVYGVIEHKIKNEYDYYQLLTLDSGSFVPEPCSSLLLLGGVGLLARRRRS